MQGLHGEAANRKALFQVASQFNLLEMADQSITPEQGVSIYEQDLTQGPACAIACGAATIVRNYFISVDGSPGQTATRQIDCLWLLAKYFDNEANRFWKMQNGYALASKKGLVHITEKINSLSPSDYQWLKSQLRVGVQWNTEVTIANPDQLVTQVYCSALPVSYSSEEAALWESFARLVLEATYEATFHAGLINYQVTGCNKIFLTQVGGGAFGNDAAWIQDAIGKSVEHFSKFPLDVRMVRYG